MIIKRLNSIPIQYIVKHWFFEELKIICENDVLIPRPESKKIVELVIKIINLERLKPDLIRFMEIGVGSGVLFMLILKKYPDITFVGIDINKNAINLSLKNLKMNKIFSKKTHLEAIDFKDFQVLPNQKFDFIITNPPYIPLRDKNTVQKELNFESELALFSGEDGLDLIKIIIMKSKQSVKENGFVIVEFHPPQRNSIIGILLKYGITMFYFEKDMYNRERFLIYKIPLNINNTF